MQGFWQRTPPGSATAIGVHCQLLAVKPPTANGQPPTANSSPARARACRAPEKKPLSIMRSVHPFGDLPLNFILYVEYYGTNSGRC